MPPNNPSFRTPLLTTKNTYEHNLIRSIPRVERGNIFDESNENTIILEDDVMDKDYELPLQKTEKTNGENDVRCPTMVEFEEGFILRQNKTFYVVMDQVNDESTLSLTNMHVLDKENVRVVYDILHGPQRGMVSLLILKPISYYVIEDD